MNTKVQRQNILNQPFEFIDGSQCLILLGFSGVLFLTFNTFLKMLKLKDIEV